LYFSFIFGPKGKGPLGGKAEAEAGLVLGGGGRPPPGGSSFWRAIYVFVPNLLVVEHTLSPMSSPLEAVLHQVERDTLGMDARAAPRLHTDVLLASHHALAQSLAAQGSSAEAPQPIGKKKPSEKPSTPLVMPREKFLASRLPIARAATQDLINAGGAADAADANVSALAESAWLRASQPPAQSRSKEFYSPG
jgi:hypothetical protein